MATKPTVLARLAELDLVPANRNAAGQIVAAGSLGRSGGARREPAGEGTGPRTCPSPARSTPVFMAPAQEAVAEAIAQITPRDPIRTLLSNSDGEPVTSGADATRPSSPRR